MTDYETYSKEFEKNQRYYEDRISDVQNKAFEYGILVVRSCVLVAGGGLLAIPAIVGLSSDVPIDRSYAALAGLLFAVALISVILASYLIHLNWTLHVSAWRKDWDERAILLRDVYLKGLPAKERASQRQNPYHKWVWVTFWAPHILAISYLTLIAFGFRNLYAALGVT